MGLIKRKKKKAQVNQTCEIARFDAYRIIKVGDGQSQWLRITTIDGGWRMDFRDDNIKYSWILLALDECRDALEAWITLAHHLTHRNPDLRFMEDCFNALGGLDRRAVEEALKKDSEQKEAEAQEIQ